METGLAYREEGMTTKKRPRAPTSMRLYDELLERVNAITDTSPLSRNEALQALIWLGLERAEKEPGLLVQAHIEVLKEKKGIKEDE